MKISHRIIFATIFLFFACSPKQPEYPWNSAEYDETEDVEPAEETDCISVPYKESFDSTIKLPIKINGIGLDMIFDTGASSTCITVAEAQYLYDKGLLSEDDMLNVQVYQTADGNISVGLRVVLREIVIGESIRMSNVEALVVEDQQAPLLLGQSVLRNFREVSVDRENKVVKFYN